MGGKWRRCDDCPRGFPSLVKLDKHRKDDHPFEVLAARLRWVQSELKHQEAVVRRYWDAKAHLESEVPIPPGAREVLQVYVNSYDRRWTLGRTELASIQDSIPNLRRAVEATRVRLRRATMMRPVP